MISVVMPVHRNDVFLESALISTFENLARVPGDLIVVIDSKDQATIESIKGKVFEVGEKYSSIFKVEESPGNGIVDALNHGFSLSNHDFIARMDSDDIMMSNRLSTQLAFLLARPEIVAVGSNIMLIDEFGEDIREVTYPQGSRNLKSALERGSFLAHPSVMLRRSAFYEVGGYNDTYRYAEDFDLWTRLAKIGDLDNIPQPLLKYRSHSGQVSKLKRKDQDLSTRAIILRNRIEVGFAKNPEWNPMRFDEIESWVGHVEEISAQTDKSPKVRLNKLDDLIIKSRRHYQFGEYRQTLEILFQAFMKHPMPILKIIWLALKKRVTPAAKKIKNIEKETSSNLNSTHTFQKNSDRHIVAVVLKGGMGNQLFQFFTGLELSLRSKRELVLDISELERDNKRGFTLNSVITHESFKQIPILGKNQAPSSNCGCHESLKIMEKSFHHTKLDIPENKCLRLEGYWQSWKYFERIKEEIPKYFEAVSENERFHGVTIHVRGGDMLRETEHFLFHGVQTSEYYEKALSLLPDKKIRVITDDIEYAREVFQGKLGLQVEIVSSVNIAVDFTYLRNSDHLVIANSTFSWWAAYLGSSKNVIAPRAWFSEQGLDANNTQDLFPNGWVLI